MTFSGTPVGITILDSYISEFGVTFWICHGLNTVKIAPVGALPAAEEVCNTVSIKVIDPNSLTTSSTSSSTTTSTTSSTTSSTTTQPAGGVCRPAGKASTPVPF